MLCDLSEYELRLSFAARTSRDTLTSRKVWFVKVFDPSHPEVYGIGECNYFPGLGSDACPDYGQRFEEFCTEFNKSEGEIQLPAMSSVRMGFEAAIADLNNGGCRRPFKSEWSSGKDAIRINGLIWMGSYAEMSRRIDEKLKEGFSLLKLKIGGINFDEEVELLRGIRRRYSSETLQLRLDANGSFSAFDALEKLKQLSDFGIHSIEQPIQPGQIEEMARICSLSPIPVALDEELIGLRDRSETAKLLDTIDPQYVILKPALCGGFRSASEIISLAEERGIGWWATSALESDIGLNAIAQWVSQYSTTLPQGLGTGQLFTNNFQSPVFKEGEYLRYNPLKKWNLTPLRWKNLPSF